MGSTVTPLENFDDLEVRNCTDWHPRRMCEVPWVEKSLLSLQVVREARGNPSKESHTWDWTHSRWRAQNVCWRIIYHDRWITGKNKARNTRRGKWCDETNARRFETNYDLFSFIAKRKIIWYSVDRIYHFMAYEESVWKQNVHVIEFRIYLNLALYQNESDSVYFHQRLKHFSIKCSITAYAASFSKAAINRLCVLTRCIYIFLKRRLVGLVAYVYM